jgi:hypothetical protein
MHLYLVFPFRADFEFFLLGSFSSLGVIIKPLRMWSEAHFQPKTDLCLAWPTGVFSFCGPTGWPSEFWSWFQVFWFSTIWVCLKIGYPYIQWLSSYAPWESQLGGTPVHTVLSHIQSILINPQCLGMPSDFQGKPARYGVGCRRLRSNHQRSCQCPGAGRAEAVFGSRGIHAAAHWIYDSR